MRNLRAPDVGTIPPADRGTADVAPVVIVRAGGLPVSVVDDLASRATMTALREADAQDAAAAALAGGISDDLYSVVPVLPDKVVRRAAIALRRDVHNARWSRQTRERVDAVSPCLPDRTAHDLKQWADRMELAGHHRAEAGRSLSSSTEHSGRAIYRHLRTRRIAAGLALASPEFTQRLLAGPLSCAPDSRPARTATAYLTRIALKTSPFSSLTTVETCTFGPACDQGTVGPAAGLRDVSSARPLAIALLLACARHPDAAGVLDVEVVHGLQQVDDRWLATLPTRVVAKSMAFRVDELTDCGLYVWALDRLPATPVPFEEVLAAPGLPAEVGPEFAQRLLEIGLLQPVLPWSSTSGQDFGELARWVRARVPATPAPFVEALERLAAQERTVTAASTAGQRSEAIPAARAAAADAFTALGQPSPRWGKDLPLFHEVDGTPRIASPNLPATVRADLAEVARWLTPHTWKHPLYDELVLGFVRRHGHGAQKVDLLDFLYSFQARADSAFAARLAPHVDPGTARDAQRLGGHGTLARAGHTVFFQVAAASAEQVEAGKHQTVISAAHPGGFGLVGRWAAVPAIHDRLAGPLASWARHLHPGCRVYQVAPHCDWADLQRPTLGTLPLLRLPGDLAEPGRTAGLTGMTLAHHPQTGTLQVSDKDGHPVAFAYLGAVPQHLLGGLVQLLCMLSNPWITMGRVGRDRNVADDDDGGRVVFRPRVRRGRLVWARARWSFPVEEVPRPERHASATTFLAEVQRWRDRHQLPDELYATHLTRRKGRVSVDKPQWLGCDHPHTIWAALGHIRPDVTAVDFTEALPAQSEHWTEDMDGNRLATEFIGMVRHA